MQTQVLTLWTELVLHVVVSYFKLHNHLGGIKRPVAVSPIPGLAPLTAHEQTPVCPRLSEAERG